MKSMKKKKWRRLPCLLILIGLLGAAVSMAMLSAAPDRLQYAIASTGAEAELQQALKAKSEAADQLADCTSAVAVCAVSESASIAAGEAVQSASVYAVGEGWFEIDPQFIAEGRRLTETELQQGDRLAMLDSELAFALFGSELPPDARLRIGESEYRVIGAFRHRRGVGEAQKYCAYVPLLSDPKAQRDALMIAAKPIANSGAQTMFESCMRTIWRSDGSFYSIQKEALRQMMLPRALLLIFGLSAIFTLLRRMHRFAAQKLDRYREELRWNYFKATLPMLCGSACICLLGYAAIFALLYALFAFSIQPLTVFTEWVPENFVKWSSLKNVFWNLTGSAAKLVKVGSREMRRVEFWGKILRWSCISALIGALLARKRSPKTPSPKRD